MPRILERAPVAVLAACVALAACASPKGLGARELARESYLVEDGDAEVGRETLVLRARADFGRSLVVTLERRLPWSGTLTLAIELAPDWTMRALDATYTPQPAEGAASRSAPAPGGREPNRVTQRFDGPEILVVADSASMPLLWLRVHPLEEGSPPQDFPAFRLDPTTLALTPGTLTLQRAADRGRRCVYRYRWALGTWCEVETDHRGLAYSLRAERTSVSRESEPR